MCMRMFIYILYCILYTCLCILYVSDCIVFETVLNHTAPVLIISVLQWWHRTWAMTPDECVHWNACEIYGGKVNGMSSRCLCLTEAAVQKRRQQKMQQLRLHGNWLGGMLQGEQDTVGHHPCVSPVSHARDLVIIHLILHTIVWQFRWRHALSAFNS